MNPVCLADQTELFIALVAAVGTDVGMISEEVGIELAEYGYEVHPLRLSDYLAEQAVEDFRKKKFDEHLWEAMTAGDEGPIDVGSPARGADRPRREGGARPRTGRQRHVPSRRLLHSWLESRDCRQGPAADGGDPVRLPIPAPTRDEHSQFVAAGAALRSAELGRQVGAAIASPAGSIIAVGTNEVPKALGGSHWEEDGIGNRDFEIGDIDTNRKHFDELAKQLSDRIDQRIGELGATLGDADPQAKESLQALRTQLRDALPKELRTGGLKDLTEFGRAVHAQCVCRRADHMACTRLGRIRQPARAPGPRPVRGWGSSA